MANFILCEICMKQALSIEPIYFGYLHEEPGDDHRFESARDLKAAVDDDLIYKAFARALKPSVGISSTSEFGIPLPLVRVYRPEELDNLVIAQLVEELRTSGFHKRHQTD